MNRTFSAWKIDGLEEQATISDFGDLVVSILSLLKRASDVSTPNESDEFDPYSIKSNHLAKLDNKVKTKLLIDMAGLLHYRACPLAKFVSTKMVQAWDPPSASTPCDTDQWVSNVVSEELSDTKVQLDTTKDELLESLRKIGTLQDEISELKDSLLAMKDSLLEKNVTAVQTAVQSEMKSYSSVIQTAAKSVKETCTAALAPSKIRSAITSASEDRSSNLIVYGLCENSTSNDSDKVKGLFHVLDEAPVLVRVERLGRDGGDGVRPVRVVMRTRETARTILGKSARLKDSGEYGTVYIAPDRTLEERVERRELVTKLKEKRENEPNKAWKIRRGVVVEVVESE